MNRELLHQALDALNSCGTAEPSDGEYMWYDSKMVEPAIAALEAELAKPEQYTLICEKCGADRTKEDCKGERLQCDVMGQAQTAKPEQEPVAWGIETESGEIIDCITPALYLKEPGNYAIPLYTSPPRKEWIGLTANDIVTIRNNVPNSVVGDNAWCFYFANAIQTKLREQNT